MTVAEIEGKVLEIITGNPGITLNGIFYDHLKEALNNKFPPIYNAVQALLRSGKIKKDGKKKNTGHYATEADIPADRVAGAPTPSTGGTLVAKTTTTSTRSTGDDGQPLRAARRKDPKGEYVLETFEHSHWKMVDESDFKGPLENLMKQAVSLVPQDYRVRHQKTDEIIAEATGKKSVPVAAEEEVYQDSAADGDDSEVQPTVCIEC